MGSQYGLEPLAQLQPGLGGSFQNAELFRIILEAKVADETDSVSCDRVAASLHRRAASVTATGRRTDLLSEDGMDKPRIYLGSSGKQEKLVQALTRGLEGVAHVVGARCSTRSRPAGPSR